MTRKIIPHDRDFKRDMFVKLPVWILVDPEYKGLSDGAKILYAILRDRGRLSYQNGERWLDKDDLEHFSGLMG